MKRMAGFSLIELLITMSIIVILLLVASPLYTVYLVKARRNEAEMGLLHLASQLEYFYTLKATYRDVTLQKLQVDEFTQDHTYQFKIETTTELSYLIMAIPLAQQAKADNSCGKLLLDEKGVRSVSGSASSEQCWGL